MVALLLNGSARKNGNTFEALTLVQNELEKGGIATELLHIGNNAAQGCAACGACRQLGKCVIDDDGVNAVIEKMNAASALVLGAPVHYASIAGTAKNFFDRLFYAGGKALFRHKVGAAVVALRRSGGIAAFHDLSSYFTISEMIVVSSTYWNIIHGRLPGETKDDLEGAQTLRVLGKNMAWLMNVLNASDIPPPAAEEKITTNFIRP